MSRFRPQITVGEAIKFLNEYPDDLLIFCATSLVNIDEPEETQEFIEDDRKRPCVAIEGTRHNGYITFGFVE